MQCSADIVFTELHMQELVPLKQGGPGLDFRLSCSLSVSPANQPAHASWQSFATMKATKCPFFWCSLQCVSQHALNLCTLATIGDGTVHSR